MAVKKMYRMLSPTDQCIYLTDYEYSESITLNVIEVEYDDKVTEDMGELIIEGINKKLAKMRADINVLEEQKKSLLALENHSGN